MGRDGAILGQVKELPSRGGLRRDFYRCLQWKNVQALEFANIGTIYFDIEGKDFECHKFYDNVDVVERVNHG